MKSKLLYVVCLAYFLSGLNVYNTPDVSRALIRQLDPSISAHTDLFTLNQIGLIFMVISTISALLVMRKRVRLAYGIMTYLLVWWSALYLLSWIQTGYWQSVYGLVNYGLTASILILYSRIVEMPKVLVSEESK